MFKTVITVTEKLFFLYRANFPVNLKNPDNFNNFNDNFFKKFLRNPLFPFLKRLILFFNRRNNKYINNYYAYFIIIIALFITFTLI